jgi:chromosome segregation ATPase
MDGFATMALREQLLLIGAMIEHNKDDLTVLLQLEQLYTAISFCMTSIEKIETRILEAQIKNGQLQIDIRQLRKEKKDLEKKIESLMERIQI